MPSRLRDIGGAIAATLVLETTISLIWACVPVLAPAISTERGWNIGILAFYGPIVSVAALAVSFEVPRLLDRLGAMGLMLLCAAVSIMGLLCLLFSNVAVACAAAIAIGFATGARNPASSQILGARTPPRTIGLVMSIKQMGVPFGGVLAGSVVPILIIQSGVRGAIVELALAGAACALAVLPTLSWLNGAAVHHSGPYRPLEPLRTVLALPGMPRFLCAALSFTAMQICLRSFFTAYLVHLGFTLSIAGLAFGCSQAAGIVGQVGWAVLSDRFLPAPSVMMLVGLCMSAGALLTAAIEPGWPLAAIIAIAMLYGVSAAGYVPVVLAHMARQAPPARVGAFTSAANLFLLGGFLVGPLLFGGVLSQLGYAPAFVVLAGCTFATSMLMLNAGGRRTSHQQD
jgi:MFS family permease